MLSPPLAVHDFSGPIPVQRNGSERSQSGRTGTSARLGNALLSVNGLYGPIVVKPSGFVTPEGGLRMKFGWMRGAKGKLAVTGHRLEWDAPPLQADVKCCFKEPGFQASYLIFPTPGCWEVVAQVGRRCRIQAHVRHPGRHDR
jgi:hypothetical protein